MVVYLLRNTVNGKGYVGQTIRSLEERWIEHVAKAHCCITPINRAIHKYGPAVFERTILWTTDNIVELNEQEAFQIKKQGTLCPNGYNLESGGNNSFHHPDTIKKMKARVFTPAHREKLRLSALGNKKTLGMKFPNRPKWSLEARAKMSAARKGRPKTAEEKEKNRLGVIAAWKRRKEQNGQ